MSGYVYRGNQPWHPRERKQLMRFDGSLCPVCGYRRTKRSQHVILCKKAGERAQ